MSRVGKKPVPIPDGVKVEIADRTVVVENSGKKLEQWVDPAIDVIIDNDAKEVRFEKKNEERRTRALHGLYRVLVANMIEGLTKGFEKKLTINGVGYNAQLKGNNLVLQIGFCHPVTMAIPEGLTIEVPNPTSIAVKGADKHLVGQFSADIRRKLIGDHRFDVSLDRFQVVEIILNDFVHFAAQHDLAVPLHDILVIAALQRLQTHDEIVVIAVHEIRYGHQRIGGKQYAILFDAAHN